MFSGSNAPQPLTRGKAWSCLLVNALVCPGLGSLAARRWSGLGQMALAVAGAVWMVAVGFQYFATYLRLSQAPPDGGSYLNSVLGGLFIFLSGWGWSIITGISLLRVAKRQPESPSVLTGGTSIPPRI